MKPQKKEKRRRLLACGVLWGGAVTGKLEPAAASDCSASFVVEISIAEKHRTNATAYTKFVGSENDFL